MLSDVSKDWSKYLDEYGLVTQSNGDGGDSLNRSCVYSLLTGQQIAYGHFQCGNGKYRRSWHLGKWYRDCDRTSRDQLIPLVIFLGAHKHELTELFKNHLKRGLLFAYNTRHNFQYPTREEHLAKSTPDVKWDYSWKLPDFTGPEFWALYIRGFKARRLYWLLPILDLETLMGSVVTRLRRTKTDVINHALVLEYGRQRGDNLVMWLARVVAPRRVLAERLDKFFGRPEEPPINELFRIL